MHGVTTDEELHAKVQRKVARQGAESPRSFNQQLAAPQKGIARQDAKPPSYGINIKTRGKALGRKIKY